MVMLRACCGSMVRGRVWVSQAVVGWGKWTGGTVDSRAAKGCQAVSDCADPGSRHEVDLGS